MTYCTPCHAIGHPSHFPELVGLTGCQVLLLITRHLPANPYLAKRRISLGVPSILNMCLCHHTKIICNQKVLIGRFHLCVRFSYETLIKLSLVLNPFFTSSICSQLFVSSPMKRNLLIYWHSDQLVNNI